MYITKKLAQYAIYPCINQSQTLNAYYVADLYKPIQTECVKTKTNRILHIMFQSTNLNL